MRRSFILKVRLWESANVRVFSLRAGGACVCIRGPAR